MRGNAEGSTLRLTLGCLLSEQLGIELRRVEEAMPFTLAFRPARRIVEESLRVPRPGGTAIFMVYNRISWLIACRRS
jgi:hypothetical protein